MKFDSLGNVCTKVTDYVANGSFKSLKENVTYEDRQNGYAALIRLADYRNQFKGPFQYIDKHGYDYLKKTKLYGNEIVISNVGAHLGTVFRVPKLHLPMSLGPNSIVISTKYNDDYYYYYLTSPVGQSLMRSIVSGSAQPKFNKTDFKKLLVPVPSLDEQNRIASKLLTIDKKIRINRQLNANLLELSKTLFIKKFGNTNGDKHIKDYLSPKRGKNLLKKNVVKGSIPVIAGGLHPAAYHNKSNTGSPVITISASGANAGFVNIWLNRVWSSDSSFIDPSVTDNVYFWYLLLKNRQKEIFDSQTGSAQPHIYPKHIENMPVRKFDNDLIAEFNGLVTPIFENIGANLVERRNLNQIKNELLNKLF